MNTTGTNVGAGNNGALPQPLTPTVQDRFVVSPDDPILITGSAGFIGSRVVKGLSERNFVNLLCFAKPTSKLARIDAVLGDRRGSVKVLTGNLLSRHDCEAAVKDVAVIYHLAAGTGEKSFPDAFMNSVVTTRNLLEASLKYARLKRFVLVSSFSVYTNCGKPRGNTLDENCLTELRPEIRGEAYCFGKVKQEEIVREYGRKFGIPYVVVRPGSVYGPGAHAIAGRVGIDTFGTFLHIGGPNKIPLTYVDNCADAIILAGLVKDVEGETFNIVDDDLPSSRQFLRLYKEHVKSFRSFYVPHSVSYTLCYLWEKYSHWSQGQLPPAFNRKRWHTYWKKTRYTNRKLKTRLGWRPKVSTAEGLQRFFQSSRQDGRHDT
ncbi:MAG: NAD-dependent epimerase/dehydratase family protein [Candidatus Acidiferrales bacterium]